MFETAVQLLSLGKFADAESVLLEVIARSPNDFDALHMLGVVSSELGKVQLAEGYFTKAHSIDPKYPPLFQNWGLFLSKQNRLEEAIDKFSIAIRLAPNYPAFYSDRGNALTKLGRYEEALNDHNQAIKIAPNFYGFYNNRGNTLKQRSNYTEALSDYGKALSLKPDLEFLYGAHLHTKMRICDWIHFADSVSRLETGIAEKKKITQPFEALGLTDSPELHWLAANIHAESKFPHRRAFGAFRKSPVKNKIRIGYVSPDFRQHPVSTLIAGLIESHDRSKYEIMAFSLGPDTKDEMQQRMRAAFDVFVEAHALSDQEVSDLIRKHEIDIAVDLAGFTQDGRTNIFAMRPAPVQVNYLGYPGTMGVEFIDYLIADDFVVPVAHRQSYSEKIVYLPHTFQANDIRRAMAPLIGSRQDSGLPEDAFVFCSFNNTYKITPVVFDVWINVLQQVEGSVLWLAIDNSTAKSNLQNTAASKGIDPKRLIFTPRMDYSTYLGSYRLADLFLDTFPFNAGTTASDALWAGLPVLTYAGRSFASRMAGSLLNAIDCPELITHSLERYQALAIQLAKSRETLQKIKQKLVSNRLAAPLFDTLRFTKQIEAAYGEMYRRCQAGLPPDHIEIKATH